MLAKVRYKRSTHKVWSLCSTKVNCNNLLHWNGSKLDYEGYIFISSTWSMFNCVRFCEISPIFCLFAEMKVDLARKEYMLFFSVIFWYIYLLCIMIISSLWTVFKKKGNTNFCLFICFHFTRYCIQNLRTWKLYFQLKLFDFFIRYQSI